MAKLNLAKRWEEAGLTDDFIFSKVFLDPQITLELLRRIFPELAIKEISVYNFIQDHYFIPYLLKQAEAILLIIIIYSVIFFTNFMLLIP